MDELARSQHAASAATADMHTPSSTHTMRYVDHDTLTDSGARSFLRSPASQLSSQGNSQVIHHYQPMMQPAQVGNNGSTTNKQSCSDTSPSLTPSPSAVTHKDLHTGDATRAKPHSPASVSTASLHTIHKTNTGSHTSPMSEEDDDNNEEEERVYTNRKAHDDDHDDKVEETRKRLEDSLDSLQEDSLDDTPPRVAATRTNRTQPAQRSLTLPDSAHATSQVCTSTRESMADCADKTMQAERMKAAGQTQQLTPTTAQGNTTVPFVESSDEGEEGCEEGGNNNNNNNNRKKDKQVQCSPESRERSNTATTDVSHTLTPHTTAAASTTQLCLSETLLPQSQPQTPSPLRKSPDHMSNHTATHTAPAPPFPAESSIRRELFFIDNQDGTAYLADASLQDDGSYALGQTILLAQRPDSMISSHMQTNAHVHAQGQGYDMAASPLPRAPCTESLSRALHMDAEEDMVPLAQLNSNRNGGRKGKEENDEEGTSPAVRRPQYGSPSFLPFSSSTSSSFASPPNFMHVTRVVRRGSSPVRSAAPAREDTEGIVGAVATPLRPRALPGGLDVHTTLKKATKSSTIEEHEEEEEEEEGGVGALQEMVPRRERAMSRRSNSPAALRDFAFDQTILLCPVPSAAAAARVPMGTDHTSCGGKAMREECPSPAVVLPCGLPHETGRATMTTAALSNGCETDKSVLQADQTAVFTEAAAGEEEEEGEANNKTSTADMALLMNSFADSIRILPPSSQLLFSTNMTGEQEKKTLAGQVNSTTTVPRAALRPSALTPQQIAAQGWIPVQVYNPHTMPDFSPSAQDLLSGAMPRAARHAASPLPLDPHAANEGPTQSNDSACEEYATPLNMSVTSTQRGWREGSPSRASSAQLQEQHRRRRNNNANANVRAATPLDANTLATISRRLSFSAQSGWGSPTLSPTLTSASMRTLSRQNSFLDAWPAASPQSLQGNNSNNNSSFSFSFSRATSMRCSPAASIVPVPPSSFTTTTTNNNNNSASVNDWAGQTVMQWQSQQQQSQQQSHHFYPLHTNGERTRVCADSMRGVDTASPLPFAPQSPSPEPREGSPSRCTTESTTSLAMMPGHTSAAPATRTEETQTDTVADQKAPRETLSETESAMNEASARALQWSDLLTSMSFQRSVALTATLMEYSSALTGTSLSLPLTTTSQPSSASASLQLHRPTPRFSDMQYFLKPHNTNTSNITTTTTTTTTTKITSTAAMMRQPAPRPSASEVVSYASSVLSSVTTQSEQPQLLQGNTGAAQVKAAGRTAGGNVACKRPPALRRMRGLPITRGSLHASLHTSLAENGTSRGHRGGHEAVPGARPLPSAQAHYVDALHMPGTAGIHHGNGQVNAALQAGSTQCNNHNNNNNSALHQPLHTGYTSGATVGAARLVPDTSVFLPFSPLTITPESSCNIPSNPVCATDGGDTKSNNKNSGAQQIEAADTMSDQPTRQSYGSTQDSVRRILPLEAGATNAEEHTNTQATVTGAHDAKENAQGHLVAAAAATGSQSPDREAHTLTVKGQPAAMQALSQLQLPVTPSDIELDRTFSSTLTTMTGVSPIGRPSVCLPALRERMSTNIEECNLNKAGRHSSSTRLSMNATQHNVDV